MNKILGKKLKFNINKYTIKFILSNLSLMIVVKLILSVINLVIKINTFKVSIYILITYLIFLFLCYVFVINTDEFINMNFTEDKTKSLSSHLKYIDKLSLYLTKKTRLHKTYGSYIYGNETNNYELSITYKKEIPYIIEGNEFWIASNILFSDNHNEYRYVSSTKTNLFTELDYNLFKHKKEVLSDLRYSFKDKENYLYRKHEKMEYSKECRETISILEKAIILNEKIYKFDEYVPHKDMINNLLDNWIILIVNYIVDTDSYLNENLIDAFKEISLMASKIIAEHKTQKEKIENEENSKIKEVWNSQSKDYAELLKSISKDFK